MSVKVKSFTYFVSIFKIDLEVELFFKNVDGLELGYIKVLLLIYADDIVLVSVMAGGLLNGLNCLFDHYQKMKIDGEYPNKSSAKRDIIRPWQVIRCSR